MKALPPPPELLAPALQLLKLKQNSNAPPIKDLKPTKSLPRRAEDYQDQKQESVKESVRETDDNVERYDSNLMNSSSLQQYIDLTKVGMSVTESADEGQTFGERTKRVHGEQDLSPLRNKKASDLIN